MPMPISKPLRRSLQLDRPANIVSVASEVDYGIAELKGAGSPAGRARNSDGFQSLDELE